MRTKEENIKFIIEQSGTKEQTQKVVDNFIDVMKARAQVDDINEDPTFKKMADGVTEAIMGDSVWSFLEELYSKSFSEEELEHISSLYEDEVFTKFLKKIPELSKELEVKMSTEINKVINEVMGANGLGN